MKLTTTTGVKLHSLYYLREEIRITTREQTSNVIWNKLSNKFRFQVPRGQLVVKARLQKKLNETCRPNRRLISHGFSI
jgi:hypothetical protein